MNLIIPKDQWEEKVNSVLAKRVEELIKRYGVDRIEKALQTVKTEAPQRKVDLNFKMEYKIPEEVEGGPIV